MKHGKGIPKHAKPSDTTTIKKAAVVGGAALIPLTFSTAAFADDYIVQSGDTMSGIAASHHVGLDILEPLNPGVIAGNRPDDYSLIFAGGHVHLPSSPAIAPAADTWPVHHSRHHHPFWRDHDGDADDAPVTSPPVVTPPPVTPPPVVGDGDNDGDDGAVAPPVVTPPPVTPPVTTPPPVTPPPVTGGLITPVIAPDGPGTSSGYVSHSPSFWIPLIVQAEGIVQLHGGLQTQSVVTRITIESSGNPNAINLTDSNAAAGHPSKGLMQTIAPTFNTYHVAGTSQNIYDPLANICAALNYINNVYGGVVPLGSAY